MISDYRTKFCRRCARPHTVRVTRCDGRWRDTQVESYEQERCACGARLSKSSTTYHKEAR